MATGRKTVVVGQVLDPDLWGNPLWDQSVQTFASAADRATQFPNPKMGAVSYLEDVKRLEVYHGASGVPMGWTPIDYRTHAELSGNATAATSTPTPAAGWVLGVAPSWGQVVTISGANLVVVTGGMFAISVAFRWGSAISARTYGEIQVGGATVVRSSSGTGDDQFSVTIPNLPLSAGEQIAAVGWQASGSAQSMFATARITRVGAGKPTAAATTPAGGDELEVQ
jgi:hypothetical protein